MAEYQQEILIGWRYKAEKRTNGAKDSFRGKRYTGSLVLPQNEEVLNRKSTAHRIADEYGIGHASVERAEHFVDSLDSAEEEIPGITQEILSGRIRPTERCYRIWQKIRRRTAIFDFDNKKVVAVIIKWY